MSTARWIISLGIFSKERGCTVSHPRAVGLDGEEEAEADYEEEEEGDGDDGKTEEEEEGG